jgi:hypothetical protein
MVCHHFKKAFQFILILIETEKVNYDHYDPSDEMNTEEFRPFESNHTSTNEFEGFNFIKIFFYFLMIFRYSF